MLSEEESENISEVEQLLNKGSQYVNIGIGEKKVLKFVTSKKIQEVEKTYNGQKVKKIRFIVIDSNSDTDAEKYFDVGRRSARLILAKLKEGYTLLKTERIGAGKDTLYIPTEVSNK